MDYKIEDIEIFEEFSKRYFEEKIGYDLGYLDLRNIFSFLKNYGDEGKRVFYAFLDLKLNFSNLLLLDHNASASWSKYGQLLDDEESFISSYNYFKGRIEVHYELSNYILRYRAIWDKIFGIIILMNNESDYETFKSSKSRKKAFRKMTVNSSIVTSEYVEVMLEYVQKFDDKFRTPETHKVGSLRKHTFNNNPFLQKDFIFLKDSWNVLLESIGQFEPLLKNIYD